MQPTEVKIWHARTISNTRRDFRLLTPQFQPVLWYVAIACALKELADCELFSFSRLDDILNSTNGVYTASRPTPPPLGGWEGFIVELTFMEDQSHFMKYAMACIHFSRSIDHLAGSRQS